jgi:hypothetical protein
MKTTAVQKVAALQEATHHKQQHINNHGWDSAMFTMLNDGKGGNKSSTTKQKMSIASTRTTRAVNVYKLDGTFIAQFDSPSQAKNILFLDIKDTTGGIIQSCNQSKQKTFRGCIFQWADSDNIEHVLAGLQNNVKIKQQTVLQYDLDGNLVATLSNANANYQNGIFSVKEDDGVIYGGIKSLSNTTLLLKLNPDLTFTRAATSLLLQDIQVGPNCLFTASDERLQSRTFATMSVINQTGIIFDNNEEDVAVIYSDPYSNNLFLANEQEDEGVRSFDKTNTTITQNWFRADSSVGVRTSIFTHPDYVNNFWIIKACT